MPDGLKKFMDETFGTPQEALKALTGVSEALTSLDEAKLRLVKSVLKEVGQVKGSPEELQMVLALIRVISNTSIEQLTAIRDILANLAELVKYLGKRGLLPKEGLKALPLREIIEEVKK